MRRLLLLLAGLFVVSVVAAAPASAHASLVASTPADGARLSKAPVSVSVTFDESVTLQPGGYLHVLDQNGHDVEAGDGTLAGPKVTVGLRGGLGDGTYTITWRVISADTHPVAGAVRFVVGNGTLAAGAAAPSSSDPTTNAIYDVVRWVGYAGLAVLGGAWLLLTVWPAGRAERRAQRLVWTGWGAVVAATVGDLLVQGPYDAAAPLTRVGLLSDTLRTEFGVLHSVRLLLLAFGAVVLAALFADRGRRLRREGALGLTFLAVLVTYALIGHATTQQPAAVSVPSILVHLGAMALWVGGLVMLLVGVPRADAAAVLPTVSRVSFWSVVALAVTGAYQAWRGVGTLGAFLSTGYGRLVLIKIVLFVVVVGVANLSRRAVQSRVVAFAATQEVLDAPPEPPPAIDVGRVRRSVLAEVVIAALILEATAVLVNEPPGTVAVAQQEATQPRSATAQLGAGRTARITVAPAHTGPVTVVVTVSGPAPESVTLTAALPAKQVGPITVPLSAGRADGVYLPVAGNWTFTLTVRTSEFDATTTDARIRIS